MTKSKLAGGWCAAQKGSSSVRRATSVLPVGGTSTTEKPAHMVGSDCTSFGCFQYDLQASCATARSGVTRLAVQDLRYTHCLSVTPLRDEGSLVIEQETCPPTLRRASCCAVAKPLTGTMACSPTHRPWFAANAFRWLAVVSMEGAPLSAPLLGGEQVSTSL